MKLRFLPILLLAGLALLPHLAHADRDGPNDRSRAAADALDWRLGAARHGHGQEIFYRLPGERRWHKAPGRALDVSNGWVIGTDRRDGGYGIYRWDGRDWRRMPGAGVDIGGSFHNPWHVNDRGKRYTWDGYRWREAASERRGRNSFASERRRDDHRDRRGDDRKRW